MASFSSVVRKGPKVAPKVAPRRNIVRKTPIPPPESPARVESEPATDSTTPSHPRTREDADAQALPTTQNDDGSQITAAQEDVRSQSVQNVEEEDLRSMVLTGFQIERVNNVDVFPTVGSTNAAATNAPQLVDESPSEESIREGDSHAGSNTPHDQHRLPSAELVEVVSHAMGESPAVINVVDLPKSTSATNSQPMTNSNSSVTETRFRQSRKRKQPPRASASVILAQPSVPATPTSLNTRSTGPSSSPDIQRASSIPLPIAAHRSGSHRSVQGSEFDQAVSQILSFQENVAAISGPTPSPSRDSRPPTVTSTATENDLTDQGNSLRPRKRRRTGRNQPSSVEEQAAKIVENAMGQVEEAGPLSKRRPRGGTPENAEEHEITPETTKMVELCSDRKWGKKSETEKEMAANWEEILRRRKEDAEQRIAAAASGSRRKRDKDRTNQSEADQDGAEATAVPSLVIENGMIVAANREVDRQSHLRGVVQGTDPLEVREDKDIFKRVLATTVGCRNPIAPGQTWDDLSTELFYTGLKKFGTDFQMISAMIPGKTRKQVKLKYNVEERKNWPRVKRCLGAKEDVNLEEYAEATGVQFASVADVYKQMEEDEKRLREEDEQRRRDEGIISHDQDADGQADVVLPSIEGEADVTQNPAVAAGTAGTERQSTTSRVGSTTTARQTAQPSGRKKQASKKNNVTSKKARQAAGKNKGLEGVEERLGAIEEVAMPMG